MDRKQFEKNIERLKTGEFLEDRAIFDYASDSLFEIKTLLNALRQCCDFQQQKIRILRRLNDALNAQVKDKDELIDSLTTKLELAQTAFPAESDLAVPADGWISVDDILPLKSGEYFTYGSNCGVYPLHYSAYHRLWNAHDHDTQEDALEHAFTEITHWYPRPAAPAVERKED